MTLAEKILARHSGRDRVKPGDLMMAKVDMVLGTDVTVPLSVEVFRSMGATRLFNPAKVVLVNDHFVPAKDVQAATLSQTMRNFAREQGVVHYYEVGRSGICHSLLPDEGLVAPGDLVVGADSHTCTYGALGAFSTGIGSTDMACAWALGELWFRVPETIRIDLYGEPAPYVGAKDIILNVIGTLGVDGAIYQALEFGGEAIRQMTMDGRITLCNMAIEAGAKAGLIEPDWTTAAYIDEIRRRKGRPAMPEAALDLTSDPDARYTRRLAFDVGSIRPTVAVPYLPSNIAPAAALGDIKVDQVVIGSCTNGRIEDFRIAAEVLGERPVHREVRLLIIPATPEIYKALISEGLAAQFMEAGAVITPPTCGPCIGGHMGVLGAGETGLFTTNRNFHGRNGHPDSRVYLAGPAVAAASAAAGRIVEPER
ncbi:MAG: 3-isopropylmalate dehydratase large subunit [Calditrichaeota bacterium]|nr:3-isopropylmalate dehydratase large subunit [Calditrichota bacterium]